MCAGQSMRRRPRTRGIEKGAAACAAAPFSTAAARCLERETQADLHTTGVGAVREALRRGAVADMGDTIADDWLQDASGIHAVGRGLDEGIVDRVEDVKGLEQEVALHAFAEREGACKTGIHVVGLIDVDRKSVV